MFRDSPEELVCEADGNPPPTIHWEYTSQTAVLKSEGKLVVEDAGFYKCNATNEFKTVIQEVKVILIGNVHIFCFQQGLFIWSFNSSI